MTFKNITVFGGASKAINPKLRKVAFELGRIIGQNNMTLIFGIGDDGMMGAVFHGMLRECGSVRGITTKKLLQLQCENPEIFRPKEIEIVKTLSERKFKMFNEGDVMVALPGGWGTVDEFAEFSVLIQTGEIKRKPLIFLNINRFWNPYKKQLQKMQKTGAIDNDKLNFVGFVKHAKDVLPMATKIAEQLKKNSARKK